MHTHLWKIWTYLSGSLYQPISAQSWWALLALAYACVIQNPRVAPPNSDWPVQQSCRNHHAEGYHAVQCHRKDYKVCPLSWTIQFKNSDIRELKKWGIVGLKLNVISPWKIYSTNKFTDVQPNYLWIFYFQVMSWCLCRYHLLSRLENEEVLSGHLAEDGDFYLPTISVQSSDDQTENGGIDINFNSRRSADTLLW